MENLPCAVGVRNDADGENLEFYGACAEALADPGVPQPVAAHPHLTVTAVVTEHADIRLARPVLLRQDAQDRSEDLRVRALGLAESLRSAAPRCAGALQTPLPRGSAWAVVIDPESQRIAVFVTRDLRIGGAK